eukprot:156667_1
MPKKKKDTDESNDEEYRDKADRWSGFHFTRLTCISILTLIIMIVALILDNLSVWGKQRKCTWYECSQRQCSCGGQSQGEYEHYPTCEANGQCGWRTGYTKWITPDPHSPGCPSCSTSTFCVSDSVKTSTTSSAIGDIDVASWDSEFNFADLCKDDNRDDDQQDNACMAMDGGNVYIAFTIFAIIFNLFTLCLIAPLYCRDTSIFPCAVCDEKTHIFLGCLYFCTFFCNFIPVVVWLGAGDGGMCDNSDPNHNDAFNSDTTNFPGYSLGGLMICIVADIVACGAVCCCWGDNRQYGEERDQAKIDRQKEKEMYKQQEAEMQQNQVSTPIQQQEQEQEQEQEQDYNQQPQQQNYNQQPQQDYNQQPQQQNYNQQ